MSGYGEHCGFGSLDYFATMTFSPARLRTAAIIGLLAVAFGAMGAHGLKSNWEGTLDAVEAAKRVDVWKTASFYHLTHAIVLLVLAFAFPEPKQARGVWWSFVVGIAVFSGTLYVLCITGMKWLGAITPIGGVLLMLGWLLLACQRRK
jgi:uncharacterized membrane protein YgdD (TMEM256/DUF423 family)